MYSLGVDIGSTTIKMALVDGFNVIATDYMRHNAEPMKVGREMLNRIMKGHISDDQTPFTVGITGSVGMGYAQRLGVPFHQEVIAAAEVVKIFYPDVHTLVDIGGEDSKMIFFEEGRVPDMRMNGNCAGGTGAFIDQTATLLGVETEELNALAAQAEHVYPIASRCGVFSKTDIQNLISRSVSKADIAASMLNAVSLQVVSALARGTEIHPKVFFCGGPFAYITELRKYMLHAMDIRESDIIVPEHAQIVSAIGTALLSKKNGSRMLSYAQICNLFTEWSGNVQSGGGMNSLPPLFENENHYNEWLADKKGKTSLPFIKKEETDGNESFFLGVDSGSTTTKLVLLDEQGGLAYSDYSYNNGNSFYAFLNAMERMRKKMGGDIKIAGSCSTGYGEQLLKTAFRLDYGIVETMAHFIAARHFLPEVSFVLDIGGQDMKAVFVENGSIRRIEINEACSSGCGSFIMTFAQQLGYDVDEFARMATFARHPYDLGTRCTVFMNSKVKQAMREGTAVEDIAAGFSYSVIKNCLYKVLKLQSFDQMGDHIMVQGGTFRNHSVVRALEVLTGKKICIGPIPELMGAYGAALYSLKLIV